MLDNYTVCCPYCGESIDLFIDYSIAQQQYTEDCSVCCRPMVVNVDYQSEQEAASIQVQREDE